ncbi:MAG: DMT family transporter [Aestuariivirga sp.]|uniref:DMT family transporter n=1 Tax=Aestuariivirga sp. TaxID=2650926 RepID=UPI0025BDD433|nr:DMT family transporter [Aestuariivirga sp.]MCA3562618.1 DMT family transporter [Aestuariivirga sp.]
MAPDLKENRTRGILWMLATMFCFIALDTMMKYLMETYSLVQVTWARFFFATVVAIVACGPRIGQLAISCHPKQQLLRSVFLMSTTGMFNAGIRTVPLATATTIMFLNPVLVTVLAIPLLGEKVGLQRWMGVLLGFIGAVIVVRPWQEDLGAHGIGVIFLLVAAALNANYQILTRRVRGDDPLTSLLYTATAGAVVTSFLVPWFWSWPTAFDWLLLAGTGVAGGLGHLFLIRAFRSAPASVVAPFSYSSLVWATLFGFVIWGDWPDLWTWAGAALIIGSGLYIFSRERRA